MKQNKKTKKRACPVIYPTSTTGNTSKGKPRNVAYNVERKFKKKKRKRKRKRHDQIEGRKNTCLVPPLPLRPAPLQTTRRTGAGGGGCVSGGSPTTDVRLREAECDDDDGGPAATPVPALATGASIGLGSASSTFSSSRVSPTA